MRRVEPVYCVVSIMKYRTYDPFNGTYLNRRNLWDGRCSWGRRYNGRRGEEVGRTAPRRNRRNLFRLKLVWLIVRPYHKLTWKAEGSGTVGAIRDFIRLEYKIISRVSGCDLKEKLQGILCSISTHMYYKQHTISPLPLSPETSSGALGVDGGRRWEPLCPGSFLFAV